MNTLFLYLDFLGFSEISKDNKKTDDLFNIINNSHIQNDSNFKTIVFSDTLLAYNVYDDLNIEMKSIEIMYIIKLVQDIFKRLVDMNIFFKAIITEGEFTYKKLTNIESYYGQALIDTYKDEKDLTGTGLFLDKKLRKLNRIFLYYDYSDDYDYIFLTPNCRSLFLNIGDDKLDVS